MILEILALVVTTLAGVVTATFRVVTKDDVGHVETTETTVTVVSTGIVVGQYETVTVEAAEDIGVVLIGVLTVVIWLVLVV